MAGCLAPPAAQPGRGDRRLIIILLLILVAIFADVIAPKAFADQVLTDQQQGPGLDASRSFPPCSAMPRSATHYPLGADYVGRDLFSRIVYGARISLTVAFIGPLISLLIGRHLRQHLGLLRRPRRQHHDARRGCAVRLPDPAVHHPADGLLPRAPSPSLSRGRLAYCHEPAGRQDGRDAVHLHRHRPDRLGDDGAPDARAGALGAREGIHRGRAHHRRRQRADHVPAHPAQHPRPADRGRDAGHPGLHLLPRPSCPSSAWASTRRRRPGAR